MQILHRIYCLPFQHPSEVDTDILYKMTTFAKAPLQIPFQRRQQRISSDESNQCWTKEAFSPLKLRSYSSPSLLYSGQSARVSPPARKNRPQSSLFASSIILARNAAIKRQKLQLSPFPIHYISCQFHIKL